MFNKSLINLLLLLGLFVMILFSQPAFNYFFYFMFFVTINLGIRKKNLINPYLLFSTSLLSLAVYNHNFSNFLIEIELGTHLLIFFGTFLFLMGMYIVDFGSFLKKKKFNSYKIKSYKKIFWICLFIGLIPHIIGFFNVGLPILDEVNLEKSREGYLPGGLSYLIFFLPLLIPISFMMRNKSLILLSVFLNGFISIVRVSKIDILIVLVFLIFSYFKYNDQKTLSIKNYLLGFSSFFSIPFIFDWFYSLRFQNADQFRLIPTDSTFFNFLNIDFTLPYLYFTSGWSNLTHSISSVEQFNFGLYTFYPFISALQLDGFVNYSSQKIIYMFPFNTFSFFTDYYMDFGVFGVVIIPFLLGIFVYYSFRKSMLNNDPIFDGQYLILAVGTLMLFFSNHFTGAGYPFIVYILFGIFRNLLRIRF